MGTSGRLLALAGALLLLAAPAAADEAGPDQCPVARPTPVPVSAVQQPVPKKIRRDRVATAGGDVMVLNGSGYNYGSRDGTEPPADAGQREDR